MGQIVFFTLMLAIYFIPSIVASGKKGSDGILALNIFAGWTGIGWLAALIWALCAENRPLKQKIAFNGVDYCPHCKVTTRTFISGPSFRCVDCNGIKD